MPFIQTFYHSNCVLLVCYSRHCLNKGTIQLKLFDHVYTELVCFSDPHCIANMACWYQSSLEVKNKLVENQASKTNHHVLC